MEIKIEASSSKNKKGYPSYFTICLGSLTTYLTTEELLELVVKGKVELNKTIYKGVTLR